MKLKLMDGVRQNKKHPETFSIPSRSDKLKVLAGVYVKLGFINPDKDTAKDRKISPRTKYAPQMDERMWALVTLIQGRKYYGVLHNEPLSFKTKVLKYGDKVVFESRHILDIIWNGE